MSEILNINLNKMLDVYDEFQKSNYKSENDILSDILKQYPLNNDRNIVAMKIAVVDITNSTQITKQKKYITIADIADIIVGITDFDERVKNGDPNLVNEIAQKCAKRGRNLFSFASKYCHFHNSFIYNKDDYSIYDNILQKNLPYYLEGLKQSDIIKCKANFDYNTYNDYIGEILSVNNITVTNARRLFDVYVWFSNK